MRISKVEIKKFRSIKEASITLGKVAAIVGENNAGKTTVLKALNAIFNFDTEEENFKRKRYQYAPRSNTYITLWLCDIPSNSTYSSFNRDDTLRIRLKYEYSKERAHFEAYKDSEWVPAPDELKAQVNEDLHYVYVPAERTTRDIACNDGSLFGEVVADYFTNHFKKRDTATSQVKNASKKIHDTVLVRLENQLNKLYMQQGLADFKIGFPDNLDYTVLLNSIQMSLSKDEATYPMEDWGSGTRSLAIIAIHRAKALLKNASVVLGIEEPETNLHPQAQKRFINSLINDLDDREVQTIFTTHSTVLVDALRHEDIILARRKSDSDRGFHSVFSQIQSDFWDRHSLREERYYQFFRYRNSDFFFSKYVVICESKNDCQVIERLIKDDVGTNITDISFLNAEGVDSIKYPYFLLKELSIPCVFVVDRDFFFSYQNGKLDESRDDKTGLPKYSATLKNDKKVLSVIEDLFPTPEEKKELEAAHKAGYRKLYKQLCPKRFLVMNYCLEMDLTCPEKARDAFYQECHVPVERQSQKTLLVNYKDAIKNITKIMSVLDAINRNSYPESYSKIRNSILEIVGGAKEN